MCQIPHEVFSLYGPMDHWDCVREFAPAGTYRYYAPQGELVTFDYTPTAGATSTYSLHSDALGSVRMIADSTGASVAHYEFDAWGNLLANSSDISFGFNYRYVGSLGVRWDATLGMHYMRRRFFDPQLQRFISRDPIATGFSQLPDALSDVTTPAFASQSIPMLHQNLYRYATNNPINKVDPSGLFEIITRKPYSGEGADYQLHYISGDCECGGDEVVDIIISLAPVPPLGVDPSNLNPDFGIQVGKAQVFDPTDPRLTLDGPSVRNGIVEASPVNRIPVYGHCVCKRCSDGSIYQGQLKIWMYNIVPDFPS